MPGNTSLIVGGAVQMRIDGDDAIDSLGEEPTDHLLADRFAG